MIHNAHREMCHAGIKKWKGWIVINLVNNYVSGNETNGTASPSPKRQNISLIENSYGVKPLYIDGLEKITGLCAQHGVDIIRLIFAIRKKWRNSPTERKIEGYGEMPSGKPG